MASTPPSSTCRHPAILQTALVGTSKKETTRLGARRAPVPLALLQSARRTRVVSSFEVNKKGSCVDLPAPHRVTNLQRQAEDSPIFMRRKKECELIEAKRFVDYKRAAWFVFFSNLLWRFVDALLDSAWFLDPFLGPPKTALVDCLSA